MAEKADGGELKRTDSYQWPSGHISHLTQDQQNALARFKQLCQEKGYYSAGEEGKTPPTHDNETMLRYLRARKFVPQQAFDQFRDTEDWRKANKLDELYETIDVQEYDETRKLYPQWTGRRDKRGIPFYVFEVGAVDVKAVTAYSNSKDSRKTAAAAGNKTPFKMLRLFALYENLCRFVLPLCSALPERAHPETPISQSSNVVDLSGVSFTKLWNLRTHMSDASKLATAHYPETLDRIFVVGAPSFFPTIWGWAKGWFDPITVSKIFILNKQSMASTLEKYIDLSNVPKKYGGTLDWKFGDMPFLEPEIANSLRWKEDIKQDGHRTLPIGPIKWQYDDDGDLVATAIGSEKGSQRQTVIAALHPESGIARLALSPGRHDASKDLFHKTAANIPPTPAATEEKSAPPLAPSSTITDTASKETSNKPTATEAAVGAGAVGAAAATEAGVTTATGTIASTIQPSNTADPATTTTTSQEEEQASLPPTSRAGTYTVPYHDPSTEVSSPPADGGRQGTSMGRFEQQNNTHAKGQLADGTPEVRVDGQGDRQAVVDPKTVGQAPKEHPMPIADDVAETGGGSGAKDGSIEGSGGQQGMLGTVQEQVMGVAGTVMSAVGLGDGQKEEGKEVKEKKEDPEVDGMEGSKVEEFLRSQTMSKTT